ncbi:MAG: preprotein translocase subunit SecA [SAR202 cluster bacterium]|nr:preprotein translocase subunit SecA [SAR202 cluster bacterium]
MFKGLKNILGGASSEKVIAEYMKDVAEINRIEPEMQALTNEQLRAKTDELRQGLKDGASLDDLMAEAFALVREAAKRTLGQRHFDVQLIGGMALHDGKIAEMRTGEGKTLVATLPAYLNALTGTGVHVVTVNDYLARRDAHWMGAIYNLLGLSVGVLQHESSYFYDTSTDGGPKGAEHLRPVLRRDAYAADITYGTNNEFGFDYLRDNMVIDLRQRVQRPLVFAIVDEVDNILVDEARTPLIISGPAEESAKDYIRFARLATSLREEDDYTIDQKHRTASLTPEGIDRLEKLVNVQNLYAPENVKLVHFAENALKAHAIFQRDREYVVKDGEIIIVDEFTGRLMPGRRYSDGLHQALEAKEGVPVQRETITYATITLQNYFRLYKKLSGMTGTAATESEEFWKIYKLDVVSVPTNKAMVRQDNADFIFRDQKAKYNNIVKEIEERSKKGQPVLVGTTDIAKSEMLSDMLRKRGITHEVLNAKQHEREAAIVAQAGRPGAVTVATNMAGRGTDIILGGNPGMLNIPKEQWESNHKKVVELGGLCIIGSEKHEARRIDNQLRGRAGRQGDPGESRFFVALDDDLMKRFGGDRIRAVMDWAGMEEDQPIEHKLMAKSVENAQIKVEAHHFDIRKHLVDYDDIVNTHRTVIYGEREKILGGSDLRANIQDLVEKELREIINRHIKGVPQESWDVEALIAELQTVIPLDEELSDPDAVGQMAPEEVEEFVLDLAEQRYEELEERLTPEVLRSVERELMLRVIDNHWVQHLTAMENLRQGIGLQAVGQRDPLVAYKKEGHEQFQGLLDRIQYDIVHMIFNVRVRQEQPQQRQQSVQAVRQPAPQSAQPAASQQTAEPAQAAAPSPATAPRAVPAEDHSKSVMAKVMGTAPVAKGASAVSGVAKVGRNDPCPCGSGMKYKKCHGA